MALLAWNPKVTLNYISDPNKYEYSPAGIEESPGLYRIFATVGLGTDTLSSVLTNGLKKESWVLPNKLVADPHVMVFGDKYLISYTVGMPLGDRNGIGYYWMDKKTLKHGAHGMIIPQTPEPFFYGIGQPCIAAKPYSPTVLFATDARGQNIFRAWYLNIINNGPVTIGAEIPIQGGNDGAQVGCFWMSTSVLGVVVTGGGWVGIRIYDFVNGVFVRRRSSEVLMGSLWCMFGVRVPDSVDGAGLVLDRGCQPVRVPGGIVCWVGAGDVKSPGSWGLKRVVVPLPLVI